uniref:Reverse transcriptase domain-containing protein n=1 Tax=Timema monikensis TaxID=170555 RepID=A0A7R9HTG4_9NEOP|nr:unnamed protein product [Timema monikensis]
MASSVLGSGISADSLQRVGSGAGAGEFSRASPTTSDGYEVMQVFFKATSPEIGNDGESSFQDDGCKRCTADFFVKFEDWVTRFRCVDSSCESVDVEGLFSAPDLSLTRDESSQGPDNVSEGCQTLRSYLRRKAGNARKLAGCSPSHSLVSSLFPPNVLYFVVTRTVRWQLVLKSLAELDFDHNPILVNLGRAVSFIEPPKPDPRRTNWDKFTNVLKERLGPTTTFQTAEKVDHGTFGRKSSEWISRDPLDKATVTTKSMWFTRCPINIETVSERKRLRACTYRQMTRNFVRIPKPRPHILGRNGAPGSDGISNTVLLKLPLEVINFFVDLFNAIQLLSHFPELWKHVNVLCFYKMVIDLAQNSSYQPISFLNCLGNAQCSLAGPVLFSLYVNDIPKSPDTKLALFTDDNALVAELQRGQLVERKLQNDRSALSTRNGLTLYKQLLRPIIDYTYQAWGHLVGTHVRRMQAFQSTCLRIIVDALCPLIQRLGNYVIYPGGCHQSSYTVDWELRHLPWRVPPVLLYSGLGTTSSTLECATNPLIQWLGNYVIYPGGCHQSSYTAAWELRHLPWSVSLILLYSGLGTTSSTLEGATNPLIQWLGNYVIYPGGCHQSSYTVAWELRHLPWSVSLILLYSGLGTTSSTLEGATNPLIQRLGNYVIYPGGCHQSSYTVAWELRHLPWRVSPTSQSHAWMSEKCKTVSRLPASFVDVRCRRGGGQAVAIHVVMCAACSQLHQLLSERGAGIHPTRSVIRVC